MCVQNVEFYNYSSQNKCYLVLSYVIYYISLVYCDMLLVVLVTFAKYMFTIICPNVEVFPRFHVAK